MIDIATHMWFRYLEYVYIDRDRPAIIMELMEGGSLMTHLHEVCYNIVLDDDNAIFIEMFVFVHVHTEEM